MSYHVCVDVGGTFTDLFAVDDATGTVRAEKASTTEDAVSGIVEALRLSGIDPHAVRSFIFGSTRMTNALV
jgi:N-methylhydantoinase A